MKRLMSAGQPGSSMCLHCSDPSPNSHGNKQMIGRVVGIGMQEFGPKFDGCFYINCSKYMQIILKFRVDLLAIFKDICLSSV